MVSTPAARTVLNGCQYLPNLSDQAPSPNQHIMPVTARVNEHDHLEVGGCDVVELVQQFGSPLYIVDEETLRLACRQYREAFQRYYAGDSLVLYASKAWNCMAICAIVAQEGLGLDVVSGGELYTALQAGVNPSVIYLHGNNKSRPELELAIQSGCTIVVDNWHELEAIATLSTRSAQPVRIMLRLTPGIECHTHEYIRTGHLDSKFGFDPDQMDSVLRFVAQQTNLNCVGLHAHIGSQIFEVQPHQDLGGVMVDWFIKATEYGLPVSELDIGGGLGICYTESDDPPSIDAWVKVVAESVTNACTANNIPLPRLLSEPGRSSAIPA